jgi:DNA segregation ATPase FtsK/SpoIIIE, S-DNA-T family
MTENPNRDDRPNDRRDIRPDGEVVPFRRRDAVTEHDVDGDGRPDPITTGQSVHGTTEAASEPGTEPGTEPGELVPVDQPDPTARTVYATVLAAKTAQRRPVLAAWMRSRAELAQVTRWAGGHAGHTALYHGVRLVSVYPARVLARAPRGAVRSASRLSAWAGDAEGRPLRLEAVRSNKPEEYRKLLDRRDDRVRLRGWIVGLGLVAAIGGLVAVLLAPLPVRLAVAAVVLLLLARAGSSPDQPLTGRAVVGTHVAKLTSEVVVKALLSLGVSGITAGEGKGGSPITFPAPIQRDGPGWRADVDLPHGVTWGDVAERRDRLASGLRRPLGCVWPEGDTAQHAGRLVLFVSDVPMGEAKAPAWPLARTGQADVFKALPFGHDQRLRPVEVRLIESNVLIGAMPGAGKTFALRVLALGVALDPNAEIWAAELKGSGDLSVLEPVAHRYVSGVDDASIETALVMLREVHADLATRAATIKGLPREVCPENKVTPQLAARRGLGLFPRVVIIDESQELFSHSEHGTEAGELATAIIKRGRALGVILLLATQRPDSKSLPTGVSANVGVRFCLRVMGQLENDMVLGTSMYRNGYRATTFTPRDKGIGWLVGASDEPRVARSAYLDGPTSERIIRRARALREAAGTISGYAAGETAPQPEDRDRVLIDLLGVWPAGEDRAWSELLCERLAAVDPSRYTGWTPETLSDEVKARGLATRQMQFTQDGKRLNRRGLDRAKVLDALGEKAKGIEPGAPLAAIEAGKDTP